jgi:hypothetical protein
MHHTARLAAFAAFLTLAAGTLASAPARAQGVDTLQAERAQLRAQLDKINSEIDALKRASRGVRDDYRLRARLADAESIARRLIDIEARLGIRVDGAAKVGPPPTAAPTDGPADLDAKADILADQSRRIRAQADALGRRAADAKSRQELRRRAADLDRDPFAPMEGSKRRIASSAGGVVTPASAPPTNGAGQAPAGGGATSNKDSLAPVLPMPMPMPMPMPTTPAPGGAPLSTLSTLLRDLLDPATMTDIRRLETTGTGGGSPQALERAAAALRARADWLDGQSRAMRAKAQAK